jgi:hypothetical protein
MFIYKYDLSIFLEGSDQSTIVNSPVGWKQSCNLRGDRGGWYTPSNQRENMLITGEDSFSWFLTIKVSSELFLANSTLYVKVMIDLGKIYAIRSGKLCCIFYDHAKVIKFWNFSLLKDNNIKLE